MPKKLFEASSIPRWIIAIIPFAIIFLIVFISQYVFYLPVKSGTSMIWLLIIGLIVGIPLGYKFRLKKKRGIALAAVIVIGFLLVPYAAFILGQMHILMKDDAMPEHWTVIEVRSTTEKIVWINDAGEEVIAYQGPKTMYLHPGENQIHFGAMSAPAGRYVREINYISNVAVDIEIDLSKTDLSPDNYTEEFEFLKQNEDRGSNWQLNGAIISFTINTGSMQEERDWGEDGMEYPGAGGPDIIIDIVIGRDGYPTEFEVTFDAPPGVSIEEPEEHHDFGE
jgi:hypothetical protein